MKKTLIILAAVFLFYAACAEAADRGIQLFVNGRKTESEAKPFLSKGRVFVPVRFVAEGLGAKVLWDDEKSAVLVNDRRGDDYLKGANYSPGTEPGISANLMKAKDLKDILDDDGDGKMADYRQGHGKGDRITNDPLVVDVRKKSDYDEAHIPGAVWIAGAQEMAIAENLQALEGLLEKHVAGGGAEEIVLYCYTGNTSGLAAGVLGARGLPVKNLMYGFDIGWRGTKSAPPAIKADMENSAGETLECGG